MSIRRLVTPGRLFVAGLVVLAVVLALAILPSNEYIFLPDKPHAVAPLVTIKGVHTTANGDIYFVDVLVRKATWLERLLGGLHHGATLYPASAINPPGVNSTLRSEIDLEDMSRSQQIAAAVALQALHNKKVKVISDGALIDAVGAGEPAVGKLAPDDVITAVDGKPVNGPQALFNAMAKHKPGDVVKFTLRRVKKTLVETVRTTKDPTNPKHAIVGIIVEPSVDIQLPFPISIDAGDVGGPSAGLAFTLEVMQKLGYDVTHGHKIAATGEIYPNGDVGAIGGIKQKTIGAREAGIDTFLVPVAGDNAADAKKVAGSMRIIPVQNFQQALRALATLPKAS